MPLLIKRRLECVFTEGFMKTRVVLFAVSLIISSVIAETFQLPISRQPSPTEQGWATLEYKTGWLLLGVMTVDKNYWSSALSFEVLGKPHPENGYILPIQGDRIRLTTEQELLILDYAQSGEKNRLASPAARQRLTSDDWTRIRLPKESILMVEDYQVGPPMGALKAVWVRVSPVKD